MVHGPWPRCVPGSESFLQIEILMGRVFVGGGWNERGAPAPTASKHHR